MVSGAHDSAPDVVSTTVYVRLHPTRSTTVVLCVHAFEGSTETLGYLFR